MWRSTVLLSWARWRRHNGGTYWNLVLCRQPSGGDAVAVTSSDVSDDPRGVQVSLWPDTGKTEAGAKVTRRLGTKGPCTAPLVAASILQPPSAAGWVCSLVLLGQTGSWRAWEMMMRCLLGEAGPIRRRRMLRLELLLSVVYGKVSS